MKPLAQQVGLSAIVALALAVPAASVHAQGGPGPGGMGPMT
jgi:hypothetical protein